MMETVRSWLTGVVAVSALLFVVRTLCPKNTVGRAAEFTGGLLLVLALLRPLTALQGEWKFPDLREEAAVRQQELEEYKESVIAQEIEAYQSNMERRHEN